MKIIIDTEKETIQFDNNEPIHFNFNSKAFEKVEAINNTKEYKLSNLSLTRLNGVHPRLVKVIKQAITNSPYDFTIIQGFRTAKEQNDLYKQGRTIKGKVITYKDGYIKKSNHQAKGDGYGYAVDFGIYDKTKENNIDWDCVDKYRAVANHIIKIGQENGLKLVWGGNWTMQDNPHIELVDII